MSGENSDDTRKQKPWIMNAFAMASPGHLAPGILSNLNS